jgi:S1-C subfamily serine protease
MNRRFGLIGILAIAIAILVLLTLWMAKLLHASVSSPPGSQGPVHSAVSGTVEFVKSRVTGGVGVALYVDTATRLPKINSVLPGSPAERAGLLPGDIIVKVGDRATTNLPLLEVVNTIRGFTGGTATLTVQRPGSTTNLTFSVHRSSWSSLEGTNNFMAPASSLATNPIPVLLPTLRGTNLVR